VVLASTTKLQSHMGFSPSQNSFSLSADQGPWGSAMISNERHRRRVWSLNHPGYGRHSPTTYVPIVSLRSKCLVIWPSGGKEWRLEGSRACAQSVSLPCTLEGSLVVGDRSMFGERGPPTFVLPHPADTMTLVLFGVVSYARASLPHRTRHDVEGTAMQRYPEV